MSDTRNELAREIFIADNSSQPREASLQDWSEYGFDIPMSYAHNIADGLIAAGWTKPRTIETVAELLALHMVVVRTAGGTIADIVNERAYVFGYEASVPDETLNLPATVLWEHQP